MAFRTEINMTEKSLQALTLATMGCAVLFCSPGTAQGSDGEAKFAAPKRIKAGDAFLGEGRLYPSPVVHDVDRDKLPDIVIGDLLGKVTHARRKASQPTVVLGAEESMKDRSGVLLKFHNW
jgi:hypothetical protein